MYIYVSTLFNNYCLIVVFSYTSIYVLSWILDYVNKINSLSLSLLVVTLYVSGELTLLELWKYKTCRIVKTEFRNNFLGDRFILT